MIDFKTTYTPHILCRQTLVVFDDFVEASKKFALLIFQQFKSTQMENHQRTCKKYRLHL